MKIAAVKQMLLEMGKKIQLQVHEETSESVTLHTQLVAKDYFDNSIYLRIVVFSSGTFHMFLTFDQMETTYDNLYLINAFNENNPWFRAYIANIGGKDFLELHYVAVSLQDERQVVDSFGFLLNDLLSENILKYLKPILTSN